MKDKTYGVSFNLFVTGNWIEDGLTISTLKRRIKEELPDNLAPWHCGEEVEVKNIEVKVI